MILTDDSKFFLPLCQNKSAQNNLFDSYEAFCTATRFVKHMQKLNWKWPIEYVHHGPFFRYFKTGSILHNYADVLAILMRLRQLCCHPKLCAAASALSSTESKCCK